MESKKLNSKPILIREVWAYNLESEFQLIKNLIPKYSFVSMDTEFPGTIFRPNVDPTKPYVHVHLPPSDNYRFLKSNVDALNLIQIGLTFSDSNGNLPDFGTSNCYIWEFNFCDFDVERHPHAPDSIQLLRRQGIDFRRNAIEGIPTCWFAQLMVSSGLVCNELVTWVTFHSAYDFGYLVKILTRQWLPNRLEDFLRVLRIIFGGNVYDIKYMIRDCKQLFGGLDRVAKTLNVNRAVGKCHQAGSDSLLTLHAFQKMKSLYFMNDESKKHAGALFGLELAVM